MNTFIFFSQFFSSSIRGIYFLWGFFCPRMKVLMFTECTRSLFFSQSFSSTKDVYFSMGFFSSYESFDFYRMNTFIFFSQNFCSSTKGMFFCFFL